jgi:SSS family solute:Na+ symporter
VIVSGVHGSAWTAVLKDLMILLAAVGLGIYLPWHVSGGIRPMFETIARARPDFLVIPAKGQSVTWFLSTVLLSALGFYMWPHTFASTYTARDENVFRRNAAVLPLYQLVLLFVFFVGFAALLAVPGLQGADADLSLLRICKLSFSPWLVGLIGAAGLLTALVPGSMLLLTASTLLAKNVYGALVPSAPPTTINRLARSLVPVVGLVGVLLTLRGGTTLVPLLLMGYNFVTQLLPALLLGLTRSRLANRAGVIAGILAGEATVAWISLGGVTLARALPSWPSAITDLNIGIVALLVNAAVTLVVSAAWRGAAPAGEVHP